jgi:Protein of unknown function (DUF2971)
VKDVPSASPLDEPKGVIYHYTNQAGLLGILSSKEIWATHIRYLNDASEYNRGLEIVKACVRDFAIDVDRFETETGSKFPIKNFQSAEADLVLRETISTSLSLIDEFNVFVTSFFSNDEDALNSGEHDIGDVLGQWRGYSGGSAGFSIGFDKSILSGYFSEIGENQESPLVYESCIYNEDRQRAYIEKRVSAFGTLILHHLSSVMLKFEQSLLPSMTKDIQEEIVRVGPEANLNIVVENAMARAISRFNEMWEEERPAFNESAISLMTRLIVPPIFMKHPSFAEEREWRAAKLYKGDIDTLRFRSGKSSLIPYIAIPLPVQHADKELIKRIVVGPTPKVEEAIAAVKMLLRSNGYKVKKFNEEEGVEVISSQIPYRDW